jgi:hypothetical protein
MAPVAHRHEDIDARPRDTIALVITLVWAMSSFAAGL